MALTREQKLASIKNKMIQIICAMEMPLLYSRQEGDGEYVLGVISPEKVLMGGYAFDISKLLNKRFCKLEDLDIYDLSGIIMHGEKMSDVDVNEMLEGDLYEE